jgi:energy-coupling factor transporter ATP-binding protein EcfA2
MPTKKSQHQIYFATSFRNSLVEALRRNRDRAIVIVPSEDKWNDFFFRCRFRFQVIDSKQPRPIIRELLLAFVEGDSDPRKTIDAKLSRSRRGWLPARALPPCFVMQPSMREYRDIVGAEGSQMATKMLGAINDLVALKQSSKLPEWFPKALDSRAFALSFMRDAETFFAFHNAGPVLSGLEFESLDGISKDLHLEFKLPTFENAHQIDFRFEESKAFARRIAVLIGKNGVGKSQALFHLAHALLRGSQALQDAAGKRPQINRLLAITSPGETRNTFPPFRQAQRIVYKRLHLSRSQWGKQGSSFGDVLVQLARTPESIKGIKRWQLFTEAVSAMLPPETLFVKRRHPQAVTDGSILHGECFLLTDMLSGGEQQRLERWASMDPRADLCRYINGKELPLSSGQITFLRFAAQACLHIENGTLMLFDEPETHLHPNLITEFIRLLDRLLELSGSLAIVATHSAYFVREVPRSQVIILREGEDRTIEIVKPRLRTLGADIGEISHFVFGDALFGRLLELTRIRLSGDAQHAEELLKSLKGDLATEAWMNLHRELPGGHKQ